MELENVKKAASEILENQEAHVEEQFDNVTNAAKDTATTVIDLGSSVIKGLFSLANRNLGKVVASAVKATQKDVATVEREILPKKQNVPATKQA